MKNDENTTDIGSSPLSRTMNYAVPDRERPFANSASTMKTSFIVRLIVAMVFTGHVGVHWFGVEAVPSSATILCSIACLLLLPAWRAYAANSTQPKARDNSPGRYFCCCNDHGGVIAFAFANTKSDSSRCHGCAGMAFGHVRDLLSMAAGEKDKLMPDTYTAPESSPTAP